MVNRREVSFKKPKSLVHYLRIRVSVFPQLRCNRRSAIRRPSNDVDHVIGVLRFAAIGKGKCLQDDECGRAADWDNPPGLLQISSLDFSDEIFERF